MPPADPNLGTRLPQNAYILRIRQHPLRGKVLGKDKDRKPLDPPPVIQLFVRDPGDPAQNYLQSPYYWMSAMLWHEKEDKPLETSSSALVGTLASSLHRLKDMDSQGQSRDGGFFVFGDLSCKIEGKYRLKLVLYETLLNQCVGLSECITQVFEVFNTKNFPGMQESTFMSRSFGDQGVRLRIRKESRQLMKRPASSYSPGQTHPSVPGGGYPAQPGYGPPMSNGYAQAYIKNEDGLEEQASKRQRSANTSPTNYIERPGAYGSMAQQAYSSQAYADPAYAVGATSMAMPDNALMAQSQVNGYGARGAMSYDGIQPGYGNYDSRQLPIYNTSRVSDAGSTANYPAPYPQGYQNGSQYPSSSGASMPNYYNPSGMAQNYARQAGT